MFYPLQLPGTSLRRISVSSFYTFGRITLWNRLVLDFHFQGVLFLLLQMHSLLVISLFRLFLFDSVLEGYMILEICSLSKLSNLLADNCRVLLWFFLYLWYWLLFHLLFLFYLGTLLFFMSLAKVHQFCLSLRKTVLCFINPFCFLSLFYLCLIQSLLFSSFCWLWDLFVLLFLRSPNHSNQTRKRGRRYPDWRGRNGHATACRWHATMYRKPWSLAGKLLELIKDFSKASGCKTDAQ